MNVILMDVTVVQHGARCSVGITSTQVEEHPPPRSFVGCCFNKVKTWFLPRSIVAYLYQFMPSKLFMLGYTAFVFPILGYNRNQLRVTSPVSPQGVMDLPQQFH